MKIVIENIALIKKAEVELNGITVVAGLNKTGKPQSVRLCTRL